MNYRDRGPRSTVVLRCAGSRNGTCSNSHPYPYKPLEAAILDWVEELKFSDNRGPYGTVALEADMASRILKRDGLLRAAVT
jgi:hypothetical protein